MIKEIYYYVKTLIEYVFKDIMGLLSDLFKPKQWVYIGVLGYIGARVLQKSYDYYFVILALTAFFIYWYQRGDWRKELKEDNKEKWLSQARGENGKERLRKRI